MTPRKNSMLTIYRNFDFVKSKEEVKFNRLNKEEEINMDHEELGGIREIVKESQLVWTSKENQEQTEIGSQKTFLALLQESQNDPEKFWNEAAKKLHWYEPWEET